MSEERVRELVRQFPENGIKQLLHEPANVSELLTLANAPLHERIDFKTMKVDPTNYITADYRHVGADLVLSASYRPKKKKGKKMMSLSILAEHQSEPVRLIILRTLEYLVQIWKQQVREWVKKYGSFASVKLNPILPVVFYTGTYKWEGLGKLIDLMDDVEGIEELIPDFKPLFVNLPEFTSERLAEVGAFGQVLRLVQKRRAAAAQFSKLLGEVVRAIETLPSEQRLRWLELLSYTQALVYHDRSVSEHKRLDEIIDASVRTDSQRQELDMVRRSYADVLRDQGREQGALSKQREVLVAVLRDKFGEIPEGIAAQVMNSTDMQQLLQWHLNAAKSASLDDVGINP